MRTMNFCKFAMLLVVAIGFSSCGDDYYYDDEYLKNSTEKLSNIYWETQRTQGNQQIESYYFQPDGTGKHSALTYRENESNPIKEVISSTRWRWINNMEGIEVTILDMGNNITVYFHDVWVKGYYLNATINGSNYLFINRDAIK